MVVVACGSHRQQSYNSDAAFQKRDTSETDPRILVFEAIAQGDLAEVKRLIEEEDVPLDHTEASGKTLLIVSVEGLKYAIVEYLMQAGADISFTDPDGKTAIDYAGGDEIMTRLLRGEEIPVENLNNLMLSLAIEGRKPELLKFLLAKGADPNYVANRKSPLIAVAYQRVDDSLMPVLVELTQILLAHPDIDVNLKVGRATALAVARQRGYQPLINLLLAAGAVE